MRVLVTILSLGLAIWVNGQSFAYMDSVSYEQYLRGDADALLATIKKGRQLGYDTYYWQMREGFAYQWKNQPRRAQIAFQKAHQSAPANKDAIQLIGNQYVSQKLWLQYWHWQVQHPEIYPKVDLPGPLLQVYIEGGNKWLVPQHPFLRHTPFASAGLSHRLGWRIAQQWTYQYLNVAWDYEDEKGNRQQPHVQQHQIGSRTNWLLGKRDELQGSLQVAQVALPDSAVTTDGMLQASWRHLWAGLDTRAGIGIARYQDTIAWQVQIGVTWYPTYRNDWRITLLGLPQYHRQIWTVGWYGQIEWEKNRFYLSLMGGYGDRPRFIDPEGLLLYNQIGSLLINGRLIIRQQVSPHWLVYAGYAWEQKEDPLTTYEQHTPFLGITYNF